MFSLLPTYSLYLSSKQINTMAKKKTKKKTRRVSRVLWAIWFIAVIFLLAVTAFMSIANPDALDRVVNRAREDIGSINATPTPEPTPEATPAPTPVPTPIPTMVPTAGFYKEIRCLRKL